MRFLLQPIRPFEFTSPVFDYLVSTVLFIKPISSIIFAHPGLRSRFTRRVINERILEIPFILSRLPKPPARVLDVGACESPLALMLASSGYAVDALDLRPYPFTHPNLKSITTDITSFKKTKIYDVVICLSTLEHIGLEVYGSSRIDRGDIKAVNSMFNLLKPRGKLLLTTPVSSSFQTHSQWRQYTVPILKQLLRQFKSINILIGSKNSSQHWTISNILPPQTKNHDTTPNAVALIVATK